MYTWLVLVMGVFYTIPALQVNLHMLQPHPQECNKGYKDDAKQTETYHTCCFPIAACTELRARVDLNGKSRPLFLQLSVCKTGKTIFGRFNQTSLKKNLKQTKRKSYVLICKQNNLWF